VVFSRLDSGLLWLDSDGWAIKARTVIGGAAMKQHRIQAQVLVTGSKEPLRRCRQLPCHQYPRRKQTEAP